jgi:hypothetical protein
MSDLSGRWTAVHSGALVAQGTLYPSRSNDQSGDKYSKKIISFRGVQLQPSQQQANTTKVPHQRSRPTDHQLTDVVEHTTQNTNIQHQQQTLTIPSA